VARHGCAGACLFNAVDADVMEAMMDYDDDSMCHACDGSGGGDYPCACLSCRGSGRARQRSGYDFGDFEGRDYTDEPCDAEVCW